MKSASSHQSITKHFINTTKKHIQNKIVKIGQSDLKWLNRNMKKSTEKEKKRQHDKCKMTGRKIDHENFKTTETLLQIKSGNPKEQNMMN